MVLRKIWNSVGNLYHPPFAVEDCVVNYVWINDDLHMGQDKDPLCTVPLHYLDAAFDQARQYPDTSFLIWTDWSLMDGASRMFTEGHVHNNAPANISLQDLDTVKVYKANPDIFSPDNNIWARTDYARLIVLAHCFETRPENHMIYSDFDVPALGLTKDDFVSTLSRRGMVFSDVIGHPGFLENSFMAFSRWRGRHILDNELIPKTYDLAAKGHNGYNAFSYMSLRWEGKQSYITKFSQKYCVERSNLIGYQMPENPLYTEICQINQSQRGKLRPGSVPKAKFNLSS